MSGQLKARCLRRDGRGPVGFDDYPGGPGPIQVAFASDSDLLLTAKNGSVRAWALASGAEVWRAQPDAGRDRLWTRGRTAFTVALGEIRDRQPDVIRSWSLGDGKSRLIGTLLHRLSDSETLGSSMSTERAVNSHTRRVRGSTSGLSRPGRRGRACWASTRPKWPPSASIQEGGSWPRATCRARPGSGLSRGQGRPRRVLRSEGTRGLSHDPTGRWLAAFGSPAERATVRLWDLHAPPAADPLVFQSDFHVLGGLAFDPSGRWLVTGHSRQVAFWPLGGRYARVVRGGEETVSHAAVTPDGQSLVSLSNDGTLRVWSLSPQAEGAARVVLRDTLINGGYFAIDRESRLVAIPAEGGAVVVPLAGGPPRRLTGSGGG